MQFVDAYAAASYVASHTAQPLLAAEVESIADDLISLRSTPDNVAIMAQCLAMDGDCRYTRAVYLALYFAMLPFCTPIKQQAECYTPTRLDLLECACERDPAAVRRDHRDRLRFKNSQN